MDIPKFGRTTKGDGMNKKMQPKDQRINLRLKHSAKKILERAAGFEGQTVSKFVLSSALARAEKTVQEHEAMMLNTAEAEAFLKRFPHPYVLTRNSRLHWMNTAIALPVHEHG